MFDPERLLGQMVSGALGGALGGRRRGGRGLGGLVGGSGLGKAQLGLGLLGVAMAAWEHYSAGQGGSAASAPAPAAPVPPPPPAQASAVPPPPPPPAGGAQTVAAPSLDLRRQQAVLLIRAMIAAAAADGRIDAAERSGILDRARGLGGDGEDLRFLEAELGRPLSLDELVAQTPASMAAEVYAAALCAIDPDTEQERSWLQDLAARLGIDPAERERLHAALAGGR